jgi:hypothetical protein
VDKLVYLALPAEQGRAHIITPWTGLDVSFPTLFQPRPPPSPFFARRP